MRGIVKKLISTIAAAALALAVMTLPRAAGNVAEAETVANGTCGTALTWTLDDGGTLTISGTGAMSNYNYNAPWNTIKLQVTSVVIEDGVTSIGNYAFASCDNLEKVTIPNSVTQINTNAFEWCSSLESISLPESVKSIGDYAFARCSKLTSIDISEKTTDIGQYAFDSCALQGNITIPSTVNTIFGSAFVNCRGLTSVTILGSRTIINSYAFRGCTNLSTVTLESNTPPSLNNVNAFDGTAILSSGKIYVPCGAVDAYKAANRWSTYASVITNNGHQGAVHIDAIEPTCTEAGQIEYWTCGCGVEKYSDANGSTKVSDITAPAKGHSYGEWQTTKAATCKATGTKERTCTNCTAKETDTIAKTAHNYVGGVCNVCSAVDPAHTHTGGTATCSKKAVCTICKQEYGELAEHNYGAWSVTKNPTETAAGTAQRTCYFGEKETKTDVPALSDTSVWTKDNAQHVEPTEELDGKDVYTSVYGTVTVTLPSKGHTHTWGDWTTTKNPTLTATGTAERACSCGEKETKTDVPALSDTSVWTKDEEAHVDPTTTTPGKDVYTSATYGTIEIVIPATGGGSSGSGGGSSGSGSSGSSSGRRAEEPSIAEVELDEKAPETEIATPDDELKDALLTEAELSDADDITIVLRVKDADPGADRQTVESRLASTDGFKVGQYIDISLFKIINGSESKLTKTNKPIKVRFEIPEELRANGRTFAVIRVHDGKTAILADLDNDKNTITIETDKFSTYALIYSDSPTAASNPYTGEAAAIFPTALLAAVVMLLTKRRK